MEAQAEVVEATAELPNYTPDTIDYDGTDVVYLLNGANRLVFRWSVSGSRYLNPYELSATGSAPTRLAYSAAHRRLYLAYGTPAVRYLDTTVAAPVETAARTIRPSVPAAIFTSATSGRRDGAGIVVRDVGRRVTMTRSLSTKPSGPKSGL